jgi:hypothetical protein
MKGKETVEVVVAGERRQWLATFLREKQMAPVIAVVVTAIAAPLNTVKIQPFNRAL